MKRPAKEKEQANQRTELLDQAAKHLRGNKLDAALKVYEQLYEQDPEDWTVANSLGDLYVRVRKPDEAIEVFMNLAEHMAGEGHAQKARALYRKVLRMRPGDAAATARVAELENEHLVASPFMQRVRGALMDAQAAVASAPEPEPAEPEAPAPIPVRAIAPEAPLAVSTFSRPPAPEPASDPEPEPAPAFEPPPVAFAPPPAPLPVVETESPAAQWDIPLTSTHVEVDTDRDPAGAGQAARVVEFRPAPDDWMTVGRPLAAASLQDRPSSAVNPTRLGAYQRMESSARRVVANGDYRGARQLVEQFLLGYPDDLDALAMLVELSVDGGFDDVVTTQIRLADACLADGRTSTARHVALDLFQRNRTDTAVVDLVERVARAQQAAAAYADAANELFDDDGLVTADAKPRSASGSGVHARPRGADPLADWLDDSVDPDVRAAVSAAARLGSTGNVAGAKAALEPLMRTPELRPVAGVGLAQIYRHEGNFPRALHCLEQALEQPPINADNAHALAYELALTLEAMGQRNEALGLYRELLSEVGPGFRDVAARAEHLSAA